jgi:hypothetical protein
MCEQIRIRTQHWTMLRYRVLVFSIESKLENKLVVSRICRLGIARDTKVSIKKIHITLLPSLVYGTMTDESDFLLILYSILYLQ